MKLEDLLKYINEDELVSFYVNGNTSDAYEVGEVPQMFDKNLLDMNVPENGIVTFCDLADSVVADNSRRRLCAGFVEKMKIPYMIITVE